MGQVFILVNASPQVTNGADPLVCDERRHNTCLHFAALYGHSDCVNKLLGSRIALRADQVCECLWSTPQGREEAEGGILRWTACNSLALTDWLCDGYPGEVYYHIHGRTSSSDQLVPPPTLSSSSARFPSHSNHVPILLLIGPPPPPQGRQMTVANITCPHPPAPPLPRAVR